MKIFTFLDHFEASLFQLSCFGASLSLLLSDHAAIACLNKSLFEQKGTSSWKKNLGFFINFINYPPSSVLFKNSSLNLEVMGWGIKLWYYVPILPSNCNINSSKILSHANFMLAKGFWNIPNLQHKFL